MNEEKRIIDEALKDVAGGSVAGEFGACTKTHEIFEGCGLSTYSFRETCPYCDCNSIETVHAWLTYYRSCSDIQHCRRCNAIWWFRSC